MAAAGQEVGTRYVAAVDQGTTSTRCMIFDHDGAEVARHQLEHDQIMPRSGWVEHDPVQVWERTQAVMTGALEAAKLRPGDLAALGLTNQRETTVVWNPKTGEPYANAIVWQDTRTDAIAAKLERDGHGEVIRQRSGLPPATYFAGGKLRWILDHVDGVQEAAARGEAWFGTIDTWLIWNLTGGVDGGRHLTDVTNAGRTMLMNLETLDWDDELLAIFDVPKQMLPSIQPSSHAEAYGVTRHFGGDVEVIIGGVLGDQHAAMVGQVCLEPGEAKNTYGTGNFLLINTGTDIVRSEHGLLTTLCYQFSDQPARYALEGSIAVTGSAVQWLRDQLKIAESAQQVDELAASVEDSGGVVFVPAFSGLFAPYWRSDARGVIVGLSRYNTSAHIARATLEAICWQSVDVVRAMEADAKTTMTSLKVDGGVTASDLCMQLQADSLGIEVIKPVVPETTALGAAYAAGLAVGFWASESEFAQHWQEDRRWSPTGTDQDRRTGHARWRKAIERTLDWVSDDDADVDDPEPDDPEASS